MKKKANTTQIIIIVICVTIGSIFGKLGVNYFFNDDTSFDKKLMKVASEMNKNCPFMVDNDTQLDNTIALPNNVFQYNYTLINHKKADLNLNKLKKAMSPLILNNIKNNKQMKIFKDNKVTLSYHYKDKNGVTLFTLNFKHEDYKI